MNQRFKKIVLLFTLTLLIVANVFAQTQELNVLNKANRLYKNGYYNVALKLYVSLLGGSFQENDLHRQIAKCNYKLKDFPNAAYWYEKVFGNQSTNYTEDDILYYANILKLNGNYNLSRKYYQKLDEFNLDNQAYFQQLEIAKNLNKDKKDIILQKINLKDGTNEISGILHPNGFYFISDNSWLGNSFLSDNDFNIYLAKVNSKNEIYTNQKVRGKLNSANNEVAIAFQNKSKVFVTRETESNTNYFNNSVNLNDMVDRRYKILSYDLQNNRFVNEKSPAFNAINSSNAYPTFSKDGRIMIFASNRIGGYGGYDLYFTIFSESRGWSDPINLGSEINTSFDEVYPHLDVRDNLYFSSAGHVSIGNLDIYLSKRKGKKWINPKNLGTPINSPYDDFGISVNQNNLTGFITSDRESGVKNIYSFAINENDSFDKMYLNPYSSNAIRLEKMPEFGPTVRLKGEDLNERTRIIANKPLKTNKPLKEAEKEIETISKPIVKDNKKSSDDKNEKQALTKNNEKPKIKKEKKLKEDSNLSKIKSKNSINKKDASSVNNSDFAFKPIKKFDDAVLDKYVLFFAKVNSPSILQFILSDLGVVSTDKLEDGRSYSYIGFYDDIKTTEEVLEAVKNRGFNSKILTVRVNELEKTVYTTFNSDEEKYNPNALALKEKKSEKQNVDISEEHYRIEFPKSLTPELYLSTFKDIGPSLTQISPNNTDVYYVGVFASKNEAENSLNNMLDRGLSSAKIVKFKEEERLTDWSTSQKEEKSIAKVFEERDRKNRIKTQEDGNLIIVLADSDNSTVYPVLLKDMAEVKVGERKDKSNYFYLGNFSDKKYAQQVIKQLNKRGFETLELFNVNNGEVPIVKIEAEESEIINLDEIPGDAELAKEFKKTSLKTTYLIRLIDIQNPALYELVFKPYGKIVQRKKKGETTYYLGEYFSLEDAKQVQENIKLLGLQTPTEIVEF